jgi:hypothetical protein
VRKSRALIGVTSLALAATSVLASTNASAEQGATASAVAPTTSRGTSTSAQTVAPASQAELVRRAAETLVAGDPVVMPTSYPYQPRLPLYRDNPTDAAHAANLLGHPDIAPKLQELMAQSDRVSVQVVGQSTLGRDLYLVTVTAPETEDETARQATWKDQIKNSPVTAAADTNLLGQYKTPVWISSNIHGNEWEGTDAAMQYIEWLATAPLSEVGGILRNNRLYFSPTLNPDGRTAATRATALGLDPNRDMITNATPETRSYIRTVQAIQPIYTADFHGYTNVLQIEPCGPPHGTNYEYDLAIPHNYALALKVEQDVTAANIPGNTYQSAAGGSTTTNTGKIYIPYRDDPDGGWDDWPPVFSAQYSAFYGAATSTVELPLTRGGTGGTQTPARAVTNTAVAYQTMDSIVEYMNNPASAREMLSNQIETFRRGLSGEPKKQLTVADVATVPGPTQWQTLWDVKDDQEPLALPNAYVIPVGAGQRSSSDAAALVEQLLLHDIEVGTLNAPATVGGTTYPAGSYVVDLDQPLRGLANALLDLGEDISDNVPQLYADGAWSYSYLWGATVDKLGLVQDGPIGATTPTTAAVPDATVPAAADYVTFDLAGVDDYTALNALLEDGARVSMLADGSAVVGPESYADVVAVSAEYDIPFAPATDAELVALKDASTKPLKDLKIAYTGTADDRIALGELGFDDLVLVTSAAVNANPALLADVDVLWVGSTFNTSGDANLPVRTAVQALLNRGGAITGRAAAGFNAAKDAGLMPAAAGSTATAVTGSGSNTALVAVDNLAGGVLAPYAQDTAYIYPATWYTGLGAGVTVEQSYDAVDPLLAGHWFASASTGPQIAAGKPSVVSSVTPRTDPAVSARAIVFGTSVFFRTNPKSLFSQAARGIFWAAPAAKDRLVAPKASSVAIAPVAPVAYPSAATVTVTTGDALPGTVQLLAGDKVVATGTSTAGTATLTVPGLLPGATQLVAKFTPSSASVDPSTSSPATVAVGKAVSVLKLETKKVLIAGGKGKAKLVITFDVPGLATSAPVVLTDNGKTRRKPLIAAGGSKTLTLTLGKGKHTIKVTYAGTDLVLGDKDKLKLG